MGSVEIVFLIFLVPTRIYNSSFDNFIFVECSRVRATTLVVLGRRWDGVGGKLLVAHACLLVLFS